MFENTVFMIRAPIFCGFLPFLATVDPIGPSGMVLKILLRRDIHCLGYFWSHTDKFLTLMTSVYPAYTVPLLGFWGYTLWYVRWAQMCRKVLNKDAFGPLERVGVK